MKSRNKFYLLKNRDNIKVNLNEKFKLNENLNLWFNLLIKNKKNLETT